MRHSRADYDRIQDPLPEDQGGIPAGEPVFLLRAKDVTAPAVVKFWAQQALEAGAHPEIIHAAMVQADRMAAWQKEHGTKTPDMPPGSGQ